MDAAGASGYTVGRAYMHTFLPQLAPSSLRTAQILRGLRPADVAGRYRYLDLGCGIGYQLVLMAAANPEAEFVGADIAPDQVVAGRALARAAGIDNVELIEASFAELVERAESLGRFDVVACHGVLSWVDAGARAEAMEAIRRCLALGGLAVFGYNAMPRWGAVEPMRHLIRRLAEGRAGRSREKAIEDAARYLALLDEQGCGVAAGSPEIRSWIAAVGTHRRDYLVHEFMPQGHTAFWHDEVADAARHARLAFAAHAQLVDNLDALNFAPEVLEAVRAAEDAGLGELFRDLASNREFRMDIFARGTERLRPEAANDALEALPVAAVLPPETPGEIVSARGTIALNAEIAAALGEILIGRPMGVGDALAEAEGRGLDRGRARQTLIGLLAGRVLHPLARLEPAPEAVERCARFNRAVRDARIEIPALASPELGSGLMLTLAQKTEMRAGEGPSLDRLRRFLPGI